MVGQLNISQVTVLLPTHIGCLGKNPERLCGTQCRIAFAFMYEYGK